jgi:putative sterol carrier protein
VGVSPPLDVKEGGCDSTLKDNRLRKKGIIPAFRGNHKRGKCAWCERNGSACHRGLLFCNLAHFGCEISMDIRSYWMKAAGGQLSGTLRVNYYTRSIRIVKVRFSRLVISKEPKVSIQFDPNVSIINGLASSFRKSLGRGMMAIFPSDEWLQVLIEKLNSDERYAQIARNWEGDMTFVIEPGGALGEETRFYLDLWHGKCRGGYMITQGQEVRAVFSLNGPYGNFVRILKGELDPMQALLTRKVSVKGNMAVLMRNVPTVLDFVRCCREITDQFV